MVLKRELGAYTIVVLIFLMLVTLVWLCFSGNGWFVMILLITGIVLICGDPQIRVNCKKILGDILGDIKKNRR